MRICLNLTTSIQYEKNGNNFLSIPDSFFIEVEAEYVTVIGFPLFKLDEL